MASEFKIGRLRFTWNGVWAAGTFYNRDAVIQYQGKSYVCLVPHTSNVDFYHDLYYVTPGGASTPYWTLMIEGKNWVGDWEPNTKYSLGNIVVYGGAAYECTVAHTGTSSFNPTQWTIYSQFDKWNSNWSTSTAYGIGDIIKYGGIVYKCISNHVSSATAVDGLEVDQSKWEATLVGVDYKQAWQPAVRYKLNDLVKNGPDLYKCTAPHTSISTFEIENWSLWLPGEQYLDGWSESQVYQVNDIVKYGGYSYISLSYNNVNNIPSVSPEDWTLVTQGYRMQSDWNGGTTYHIGDVVRRNGNLYAAVADNSSEDPAGFAVTTVKANPSYTLTPAEFGGTISQGPIVGSGPGGPIYADLLTITGSSLDPAIFDQWYPEQSFSITVNGVETHTYTIAQKIGNSVVLNETLGIYGVVTEISFTNLNDVGTTLTVNSTTGIVRGMIVIGPGFTEGQTVVSVSNGTTLTVSSPADGSNIASDSIDFVGVNYVYWTLVSPGNAWKYFWELSTQYVIGDLVVWQNATYKCIRNHQATQFFRPDLDIANEFWIVFNLHARENAGNTQGDLVAYKDGKPTAIPILPESTSDVGATDDFLLSVAGTQPNWKKMFVVPDVYYVAPTGVDDDAHGDTLDKPWASVKYACEKIAEGFFFKNASTFLVQNKDWLIEEMYLWMLAQKEASISPFTPSSVFDEESTRRDAKLVIDALVHDIVRGSNGRIVTVSRSYFSEFSDSSFFNDATDAAQPFIVASLNRLKTLISFVYQNADPDVNYQELKYTWSSEFIYDTDEIVFLDGLYYQSTADNNTESPIVPQDPDNPLWTALGYVPEFIIPQYKNTGLALESGALLEVYSLMDILIYAIQNATTKQLPRINTGLGATIYVKTGTYSEDLPIVVPDNTAVVGDELRGATIQPKNAVYTITKSASAATDKFTLNSTTNLEPGMPIQFSASSINDDFGGVTLGQTYYVKEVTGKQVSISETVNGDVLSLTTGTGIMTVYAGNCLKDMFYMHNATGLRNLTLTGLAGSLSEPNQFSTRRPTGGAYSSLNPGNGPTDTRTWIINRSPYIQNVTTFGVGCTGLKIDGTLHNGGNRSIVANDYTQILSDGIGVWCTGSNSLTECVSVFAYYCYAGYFAEDGGRIRATNGNSSYGTYGVIAEGFDATEVPISGLIDNRSSQVQASVQSAFGSQAQLVSLQYQNAGSNYTEQTTNLVKESNHFHVSPWASDSYTSVQQNALSPFGDSDAWTITGTSSTTGQGYIYQDISILPAGIEYLNVGTVNITGSGNSASFDITVTATGYLAVVNTGGTGYVIGNELRIPGSVLGGIDGDNDCFLTVSSLSGSSILDVTVSGTVPTNSDLNYTFSVYAKQSTAAGFDIAASFSGDTTATTFVNYNFVTENFLVSTSGAGVEPVAYNKLELPNGWYRFWITVYDPTGLNNNLQVRIYPKGVNGLAGSTIFYGSQAQISATPTFYQDTGLEQLASYANFTVTGAGTGAKLLGNEIRSNSVFQTRITDEGGASITGGKGYLIASNNAQGGDANSILLSGSDINLETNYVGMRVFLQSGTGAGQYGYISSYDDAITKKANILKESFDILNVASTTATTNVLTLGLSNTTDTLYENQKIQFIPTYYTTTVGTTGIDFVNVTSTVGGSTNQIVLESTRKLSVNMPIRFTGATYGGVINNFTYFIKEIVDDTHIIITTELFGQTWQLNSDTGAMVMTFPGYNSYLYGATSNMKINMPIQFTGNAIGGLAVGTKYYVNDVLSSTAFTISPTLVTLDVTATAGATNYLTAASSTSVLVPFNPLEFSGTTFGNVVAGTKYYVNKIINTSTFTIVDSLIETRATATETLSNLITVTSTTGFVVNNPIQFVGNTFGGLVNSNTYYILAINDETTFTVSTTPGGSAVNLSTALGDVLVRTTPDAFVLTSASGNMTLNSTSGKVSVSQGYGSMNGTYSTSLFGNVSGGTTYYVKTIIDGSNFTVSTVPGGSEVTLKDSTGSMNVAAVGWDHINPGTPIEGVLDNSTIYYVEPRLAYTKPGFSQQTSTTNTLATGTEWKAIAYGDGMFVAMPSGNAIAAKSTDGITWSSVPLLNPANWTDIAYGNSRWVAISSEGPMGQPGSLVVYSSNDAEGWRETYLPSATTWSHVAFGNGKFVAIAAGTSSAAYSANSGKDWTVASGLPSASWSGLTYGNGKFVAVAAGGTTGAYSTDGITWQSMTLPESSDWSSIAYGNGLYVAVSSTGNSPAYSLDGISWTQSDYVIDPVHKLEYGQGVFLALSNVAGVAYTTENGYTWNKKTVADHGYGDVAFGWLGTDFDGGFVTVADRTLSSVIEAGCQTKGRAIVTSGTITSIIMWEPGSGYQTSPVLAITDPNVTLSATTLVRVSNGVLANPTFINRGQDYNTNTTRVTINGGGYADTFQTGLTLIVKNLSKLPAPGDNLLINGNSKIYKVTRATPVFGTVAPNIQANLEISPEMTVEFSPAHETTFLIRTKYSQARLTNHDFLNVGYGNYVQSNYPNLPEDTVLAPQDQAVEVNYGRVFYTSTDQDGNFKVGDLFGVEQATGIVTLSATQFGLSGLETLSLGGIAVGGSSVIIRQFSTDETFIANSNNVVPTQRAIKAYLTGRLSQGGSNTFTGQLIAGTVVVGGADKIRSTIPNGTVGSVVNMPTTVRFQGQFAGWDGDGMALQYFIKSWNRKGL